MKLFTALVLSRVLFALAYAKLVPSQAGIPLTRGEHCLDGVSYTNEFVKCGVDPACTQTFIHMQLQVLELLGFRSISTEVFHPKLYKHLHGSLSTWCASMSRNASIYWHRYYAQRNSIARFNQKTAQLTYTTIKW